jgi:hypothetical protein
MRRPLGTLATAVLTGMLLVVTAGCGASSSRVTNGPGGPAYDPAGHPSRTPGPVDGAKVVLVSMTGGSGGRPSTTASELDSRSDVARFLAGFNPPIMRAHLGAAIDTARRSTDRDVYGQVLAVGCDRPPGADVVVDEGGQVSLVPHEVASPLPECLAAVTTVAVATLPQG